GDGDAGELDDGDVVEPCGAVEVLLVEGEVAEAAPPPRFGLVVGGGFAGPFNRAAPAAFGGEFLGLEESELDDEGFGAGGAACTHRVCIGGGGWNVEVEEMPT